MNKKLAIIILNYKTPGLVIDCLNSLENQIEPGIEVVIVDNDSNDGSAERISEKITLNDWGSWSRVLCSPVNGGFAAGNNFALKTIKADAYILLNSDTIVLPNAISELLHAMEENPKAGLIGPAMDGQDGKLETSTFRFIRPITELIRTARTGLITKILHRYDVPLPAHESVAEPEWIGFACVLIRREVIEQIGFLDEGYFMYFEDVDYCHRVRQAGWTILYWPKSKIIHLLGGSSKVTSKDTKLKRAPRYFYEARSRYFAKHYGKFGLWLANFAWIFGRFIFFLREKLFNKHALHRENEARDIWINALDPFQPSTMLKNK